MKSFTGKLGRIFMSLGEILIGILLLINPIGFTTGIICAIGIALIVVGALNILHYFRTAPDMAARTPSLSTGLVAILIGVFCVFKSEWFIVTFPLLTIIYGVFVLVLGMARLQWAVDLARQKQGNWVLEGISAGLSVIFAILIVLNPFSSTAFLWTFTAISIIFGAILDILAALFTLNRNEDAAQ